MKTSEKVLQLLLKKQAFLSGQEPRFGKQFSRFKKKVTKSKASRESGIVILKA